jgi:signal peptidase II
MYFLITLIIDQIIKYIVVASNCSISIIPNIFNLMYVKNTGGVYGIFQNSNLIFTIISIIVLIILFIYSKNITKDNKLKQVLWQLILAGGASNLIDRIFRGFVVDFVQMLGFGVFNLADACIVISAIIIIFLELKEIRSGSNRKSSN